MQPIIDTLFFTSIVAILTLCAKWMLRYSRAKEATQTRNRDDVFTYFYRRAKGKAK